MTVQGRDCLIVIKTQYRETGVPYTEETIREAVSLLTEEAAIEGDGSCRAIRKSAGVTGCVVTPLTIGTAPLLLYLAMGLPFIHIFSGTPA
jgi:cbb3-type cytochrome oxidase cytochrome c subunit